MLFGSRFAEQLYYTLQRLDDERSGFLEISVTTNPHDLEDEPIESEDDYEENE